MTLPLIGEFFTRNIPDRTVKVHTEIIAALTANGLDPKLAGGLSLSEALGRVVKELAKGGLIHNVRTTDEVRFQLDDKAFNSTTDRVEVSYRADVRLDRKTGTISSSDPIVESQAKSLIVTAQQAVKTQDIGRIIVRVIEAGMGRVFSKGGSSVQFFIPERFRAVADRLEGFLRAIGCSALRVPVVDVRAVEAIIAGLSAPKPPMAIPGAPPAVPVPAPVVPADCGIPAVIESIEDGLMADIYDIEKIVKTITKETRESTVTKACDRILEVATFAETVRDLIGDRVEVVRDYAAFAAKTLRDLYEVKKTEADAVPVVEVTPSWEESAPCTMRLDSIPEVAPSIRAEVAYDSGLRYAPPNPAECMVP